MIFHFFVACFNVIIIRYTVLIYIMSFNEFKLVKKELKKKKVVIQKFQISDT